MGVNAVMGGLSFLLGTWQGQGVLRGTAVTSRSVCVPFGSDMLKLDSETFKGGTLVHKERILWRTESDGSVTCTTSPWRSKAQVWRVEAVAPGQTWRHLHPGLLWEIRRAEQGSAGDADAYDETFDVLDLTGGGAPPVRVVALRHVRVPDVEIELEEIDGGTL